MCVRDRYLRFLSTRDGEADFTQRTLTRREEFFAALARDPVRSRLPIDGETYLRNLDRRRPERGLDQRMLWLLATAKANQAERFGVGLAELYGRIRADSDRVQVHVQLQEIYHTRILSEAVAIFGLPVYARPPALLARALIRWMITVPETWRLPVTGCAEMAGCVLFRALRDRGLALFGGEPAVAARIGSLYDEILADEVSHVGFIASQLGSRGRSVMRALYRLLGVRLAAQMPEVVLLLGRGELRRRFGQFELAGMASEYPGLAFTAATI
jgi:hypothetical protein